MNRLKYHPVSMIAFWVAVTLLPAIPSFAQICPENDCSAYEQAFYHWDGYDGRLLVAVPVSYLVTPEAAPNEVREDPEFPEILESFNTAVAWSQQRTETRCSISFPGLTIPPEGTVIQKNENRTIQDTIEFGRLALLGTVEHVTPYWGSYKTVSYVAYLRVEEVLKDEEGIFEVSDHCCPTNLNEKGLNP